jgi:oligoendopeptidase F
MPKPLLKRTEVPEEHTWDIKSVFASDEDWEAAYAKLNEDVPSLTRFSGRLGESAPVLLEALQARDDFMAQVERVALYGGMQLTSDTGNQTYLAHSEQAEGLAARTYAAVSYYEPEILSLEPGRLQQMIDQEPGLKAYEHYFDKLE